MKKWQFKWHRVIGLFFIWLGLLELVGSSTVSGGYSTGMVQNPVASLLFFIIGAFILSLEVKDLNL